MSEALNEVALGKDDLLMESLTNFYTKKSYIIK